MMKVVKNNIPFVHSLFSNYIKYGDVVIDATLGNGNDTIFLANLVGDAGKVYAFDTSSQAIVISKNKLKELNLLSRVNLFHTSHVYLKNIVKEKVSGIIFNLGYFPNLSKKNFTFWSSTLEAIEQSLFLLKKNAILAIIIYTGHEQGKIESKKIEEFAVNLSQKEFDVLQYKFINRINNPPYAIIFEKLIS